MLFFSPLPEGRSVLLCKRIPREGPLGRFLIITKKTLRLMRFPRILLLPSPVHLDFNGTAFPLFSPAPNWWYCNSCPIRPSGYRLFRSFFKEGSPRAET